MLKRKFESTIESFLTGEEDRILLVNGARQIGKSYLIRYIGSKLFKNFIEINLKEDKEDKRIFENVKSTKDLYIQLSSFTSQPLGDIQDTLIFLDEIQCYPHLLTLLKFLRQEGRYRYIASGSELGIALYQTPSVPIGSVSVQEMYPLDFEEFLWASNVGDIWIDEIRKHFNEKKSLPENMHNVMMGHFQYYLLVGGMPDAVNAFIEDRNIINVRRIQKEVHDLYKIDASQYDEEHRLAIRKIYDLIPSNLENKKKRIYYSRIENKKGKTFSDYAEEFEYLTNSGIALEVSAISNPRFPLIESDQKRLVKLYLNDVGLLTDILYNLNVNPVLRDIRSINLGTVYESVVAQELTAHGFKLHYYDNKKKGEIDFLLDDYETLTVLPLEVKSGKDYTQHSALNRFINDPEYNIKAAYVLSNERNIFQKNGVTYIPVYFVMFFNNSTLNAAPIILPEIPLP